MLIFLFPGQGSQSIGMARDLFDTHAVARAIFEEADDTLGFSLSRLCFEGPAEKLQLTAIAQPAILTASIAAHRVLHEQGVHPEIVAGHSLGEYSALVAAGGLSFADAVRLVHKRGTYMQEAVPVGEGAMAAVIGLETEAVTEICRESAADEVVSPANLNAPEQVVISGHAAAVDRAVELSRSRGATRAVMLQVSAPFHCALMEPAARRLATDLEGTTFNDLRIPLVCNVRATVVKSGPEARAALIEQVTAPVRWEESVRVAFGMGVDHGLEVGPGRVLTGLIRKIERGIVCKPAGGTQAIEAVMERRS